MNSSFVAAGEDAPANMNAMMTGNNPKLQTVKYSNVLPEGKLGNYKQNDRVDFMPNPATCPYFDGAQSYLNIQVRNTSTFNDGNSANPSTAAVPLCFPANMGVNAVINRCLIRAKDNSQVIEDLEAYNLMNGIKNAYTQDSDVFKTLGRISGVAGRTPSAMNQTADNLAVNYFLPNGEHDIATSNAITGGNTGASASFCVPVESGLMSAFAGQHHVVPNLDVPLHMQFFLEKNNTALQALYHKFYRTTTVQGTAVVDEYALDPFADITVVKAGTELLVPVAVCNTKLTIDGKLYTPEMCSWRVGQALTDGTDTRIIASVEVNQGAAENQIKITLDVALTAGDGDVDIKLAPATREYTIDKIELKLLLTIPDDATMRMIRSQMARGISFASYQLYKQSTSQGLVNAVIDVPEALTKVMSMLAVPVDQNNLETLDESNQYVYCRPSAANPTNYQWQIQNTLIPNLSVQTNAITNVNSDNAIYYNQVVMALRHMLNVKALADDPKVAKVSDRDIDLPFFYPISLSPKGQSFNLINSAPQLRLNNGGGGADITPILFHIFAVHTRILKSTEMGAEIDF